MESLSFILSISYLSYKCYFILLEEYLAVKAPKSVSFFGWSKAWGKIFTYDNIIKRGFSLVGWCCMCWCSGETMDHLLLQFDVAYVLWSVVFKVFGIHWVFSKTIVGLLFGWKNWFGKHSSDF